MSEVHLLTVRRLVVFVHPGIFRGGNVHLVALCDAQYDNPEKMEEAVNTWKKDSICLYDGPPLSR